MYRCIDDHLQPVLMSVCHAWCLVQKRLNGTVDFDYQLWYFI